MRNLIKNITTVFGVGYLPLMPGTYASMLGVLIYLLTKNNLVIFHALIIIFIGLGLFFSGRGEELFKKKDPGCIVIDELAGMLLTFFLVNFSVLNVILGFFLFRIFDIFKPLGIRKLQKIKGSLGIMADDICAAILVNLILQVFTLGLKFAGF